MAFFAGSKVLMADGSKKNIENIAYGDYIKDFQGNPRMVDGIRVLPVSLKREFWLINETFLVTNSTVISAENYKFKFIGQLYDKVPDVYIVKETGIYTAEHNQLVRKWVWFDESYNITHLELGHKLMKEDSLLDNVFSIRQLTREEAGNPKVCYVFSADSGTCWIDGYLCTCRFSEKWDYNLMQPIDGVVTITCNTLNVTFAKRHVNIDFSTNEDAIWDEEQQGWLNHWMKK